MVAKVQRMRSRLEATTAERDALKAELVRRGGQVQPESIRESR